LEIDKKLVIAALVILFGGNAGSIINAISPDFRAGAFTLSDGKELEAKITLNELYIEQIMEDDEECQSRQDVMKSDLTWLRELVTTYQSSAKQRDETQDWKLEQCMRKLQ
jgi:hypothetical protein